VSDAPVTWAVRLEYDGGAYIGWQKQANGVSIQGLLEEAASRIAGGRPVPSITAGRTDAGVHAGGQVIQLDFPPGFDRDTRQVRDGINFHLKPHPIVVLDAAMAAPGWNARFSAIRRRYRYRILNRPARPALDAGQVWHVKRPLDAQAMHEGAQHLLGRHDFSSFRAASCQANSPMRTLDRLDVARHGDIVSIEADARSFLHHQVRNMVGSLQLVGWGAWTPADMRTALEACDRSKAGPTAPPDGLALIGVDYPDDPFAAI